MFLEWRDSKPRKTSQTAFNAPLLNSILVHVYHITGTQGFTSPSVPLVAPVFLISLTSNPFSSRLQHLVMESNRLARAFIKSDLFYPFIYLLIYSLSRTSFDPQIRSSHTRKPPPHRNVRDRAATIQPSASRWTGAAGHVVSLTTPKGPLPVLSLKNINVFAPICGWRK